MADDKQNVILDVRTPEEFQAGHIPGAVNLDVNASDFQTKAALLDRIKIYLVQCASGVHNARACDKLNQLDFPNRYNLPGGFRAWAKAGKPVEKQTFFANTLFSAGAGRIGRLSVLWPGGKRFETCTVNRLEQKRLKLDRLDYW
jgi:rhodanese-related sulfurtransferase